MHLAYSALRDVTLGETLIAKKQTPINRNIKLRHQGYQAACQKYKQEIAAIQQYFPGWQPAFK
jgi:hypothetical protein